MTKTEKPEIQLELGKILFLWLYGDTQKLLAHVTGKPALGGCA